MRLDHYLVNAGLVHSRSKAQQLIKSGAVTVDGLVVDKAAFRIAEQTVDVTENMPYVSRAALKLKGFLPLVPFECKGISALDIGASTGGFTQVMLEEGITHVDAVDVGRQQLHPTLKSDPRITSIEQTDIRNFFPEQRYELVTSDVSFIALHHILADVDRLAEHWIILLFKPQFEVGRDAQRDRRGVVTDTGAIERARSAFESACDALGWQLRISADAVISGKEGNLEICYCYEKC